MSPVTGRGRALIALLLATSGCGPAGTPTGRPFVDDLGRTIALTGPVERVVTLAPSVTELAFEAGASHLVVGVTDADDHPGAVTRLPRIQALPVDHEAVVALRPDLVLASDEVNDPRDADRLAALGIPTYFVRIGSLGDVTRSVRNLGTLLGTGRAAREAADSLDARLGALARPPSGNPPDVLVLVGDATLFSFGRGSYVHEMVSAAGGRSITVGFEMRAPVLSEEFVIASAPDVIIGAFGTDYDPSRLLELHPAWKDVPAVRDGRVHSIDPDLVLRPGPRLVLGVEAIRRVLGPPERGGP
jgi:ABC-type Fe3+-hydroxamate transport system substrate-binding protein